MNYKKSVTLWMLLLSSNIISAGILSKFLTTGVVLYIHQNIMTQQDLTKRPSIKSEEVTDYINKCSTTIMNTRTSLQPLFKVIEESLKAPSSQVTDIETTIEDDKAEISEKSDM